MGMREEFEAWVTRETDQIDSRWSVDLTHDDQHGAGYVSGWVDGLWKGWRASREELVIQIPVASSSRNDEVIKAVARTIIAQGLRVVRK